MARLFNRRCSVIVDSLKVDGLDVAFKVVKSIAKEPNSCEVSIFNLSDATRAGMQKKGARVVLSAGYVENIGQIFAGDSRFTDHVQNGPDWLTKLECGDGERAYRFARINESFRPGTRVVDVIIRIANAMGLDASQAIARVREGGYAGGLDQFVHGYAASGRASAELDSLMRSIGFEWSVQDGAIQALPPEETLQGTAVLLSPGTGLVGSPEHGTPEKKGKPSVLKAKSLLQPRLRPGVLVQVDSAGTKGLFKCGKTEHTGDTRGGAWYSEVELTPVS